MNDDLRAPLSGIGRARGFVSVALRTIGGQWAYRGSTLMALASSAVGYFVLLLVWRQAYAGRGALPAYPPERLFAYLAVAFILNFALTLAVEVRFGSRLQSGMIAFDVMRPLGCMPLQLARAVGEALSSGVVALVLYGVGWAVFGNIVVPPSAEWLFLGLLSAALALLLNFAIGYLAAQGLFLTLHYYGVTQSRAALHYAFSGLAAPLALFPPGLRSAATVLPFRHVIETPVSIILGLVPRSSVPALLCQQVAWALGLLALAAVLFQACFRRHQLQGG